MSLKDLGDKLDGMGWTLVELEDPVDRGVVPALDWEQVAGLVNDYEEALEQYRTDISRRDQNIRSLRVLNLDRGAALNAIWNVVVGSEQPEMAAPLEISERIIEALESEVDEVEVTDAQVEALGNAIYGPAVVWDREKIRNGLVLALQIR